MDKRTRGSNPRPPTKERKDTLGTKITLDAGAIEKLIEVLGPDFKLSLKQAALEEASRRTIRAIVPEAAEAAMKQIVKEGVEEQIGKLAKGAGGTFVSLNVEFRERIKLEMKRTMQQELHELLDHRKLTEEAQAYAQSLIEIAERDWKEKLPVLINTEMGNMVHREVRERLEIVTKNTRT